MTIYQQDEQTPPSLFDPLYCQEDNFEDEEDEKQSTVSQTGLDGPILLHPMIEPEREEDELNALFSKERNHAISIQGCCCDLSGRKEMVEWMLMVNNHFGFSTLTTVLSVNYLDRFLTSLDMKDKPIRTLQLAALSCLSLAAKVEEDYVPLLVDLQIDETEDLFEAKEIEKMELIVLSTLEWKMHPVTPVSFLDHVIRRLGLNHHPNSEFMRSCERLLLSLLPYGSFVGCLPSVLAAAIMMHIINQIDPHNALDYHNQVIDVLKISKEKVKHWYQLMKKLFSTWTTSTRRIECNGNNGDGTKKRKWSETTMTINKNSGSNMSSRPSSFSSSPSGVIDASFSCLNSCDSSNDSWAASTTTTTINSKHSNNNEDTDLSLSSSLSTKKGRMMCEHRHYGAPFML